jgi:hypothetical protein
MRRKIKQSLAYKLLVLLLMLPFFLCVLACFLLWVVTYTVLWPIEGGSYRKGIRGAFTWLKHQTL